MYLVTVSNKLRTFLEIMNSTKLYSHFNTTAVNFFSFLANI